MDNLLHTLGVSYVQFIGGIFFIVVIIVSAIIRVVYKRIKMKQLDADIIRENISLKEEHIRLSTRKDIEDSSLDDYTSSIYMGNDFHSNNTNNMSNDDLDNYDLEVDDSLDFSDNQ